jgi:alpha-mannosidase
MKRLHLLCNAHLDPVWLWEWEEGAAEAISTFRTAADLCEEFEGFVFNHNEVTLYKWVEEYEPELFARIQRLVKAGKWHIMGGWYLQPDCNMPSGESFVRQALLGRLYFLEKFGVMPTTAINFDPFGHTRGLVQILRKAGYDSYLFGRPHQEVFPLPDDGITWVGYDGSEVAAHRFIGWYNAPLGKAREKVEQWLQEHGGQEIGLVLWGVGNHGGGPSRKDCADFAALIRDTASPEIVHSTPEQYFADVRHSAMERPRVERDLNSWATGCYTSQVRLKQKHRLLENELYMLEKMASTAALQGLMPYPQPEIHAALCDLMVGEFHDILPGSSVQGVEEAGIRLFDHALEIVSRLKARAFFTLAAGQPKGAPGQVPVLACNPHPFPLHGVFECEFNLPDFNFGDGFTAPVIYQDGRRLPCQIEKEAGNLPVDWRKRMVFRADLAPSQMNRFDCTVDQMLPARPQTQFEKQNGNIVFKTSEVEVVINGATGLLDRYAVGGVNHLGPNACRPLVVVDNPDPWGSEDLNYRNVEGAFTLMEPEAATRFSGLPEGMLDAVRVVEDGEVRTVVEAVMAYAHSFLVLTYKLPKAGTELEIHVRVHWNEKDRMLKLALPVAWSGRYWGQVAFGCDRLPGEEREVVAQKWVAAVSETGDHALTCINDGSYGSDFPDGEIRLTLLRSPAYSALPFKNRPLVRQDGYTPRMEQGERQLRFWLNGGTREARMNTVDREALAHNEKPFLLSFSPSGQGRKPLPGLLLGDDAVQLVAFKKAERSERYVIRLFEPTGQARTTRISIPALGIQEEVALGAFEVKTLLLDAGAKSLTEADLMERPLG